MLWMQHPTLRKIANGKRDYREQMQVLFLSGMARHRQQNEPESSREELTYAGFACMCAGYRNLRDKHKVGRDRYIKRVCKQK